MRISDVMAIFTTTTCKMLLSPGQWTYEVIYVPVLSLVCNTNRWTGVQIEPSVIQELNAIGHSVIVTWPDQIFNYLFIYIIMSSQQRVIMLL